VFRNYLARLQMTANDKPLLLGEYGIDTHHEKTEEQQAEILTEHVKAVFEEGLVGTFIFSFTDDWFTGGYQIDDWSFGVVRRDRTPKPAFERVAKLFARVPQTAEQTLPRCSVIICSYNGASTVETCLRSMERLKYPDFEVIFVDDGSKDHTQEILKKFPWVKNIRQENMGLSFARNVGMRAASGEIIVYTDSDCEADEDWLYYIALTLTRSKHVGVGGPNLIPDEGSWIADCVGLSPGGPTHVMIDDRTAEHVPGCNMAFYRWAALEIEGFDPQFRSAGDDVDFIWRLQHRGYSIGFAPSAQVWHYRRNTVTAYLKQQRGYGAAEAMLKYKHPDHFNALGASFWRGKIYGADEVGVRTGGDVVYHGVFGTGLFQTIYRKPASMLAAMLMSIEWHMLAFFILLMALAVPGLFWVVGAMELTPIALAITAAIQAPTPRHSHPLSRLLIAWLHWRQPVTRGWARYSVRLKNKVMNAEARGYRRSSLPFDRSDKRTLRYWNKSADRIPLLQHVVSEAQSAGWRMRIDSGWAPWDMEIYGSRYCKARVTTATEHYGEAGNTTRVRVELLMSKFCAVLTFASLVLAGLILLAGFPKPHLWPFARPAVLIPIVWWTMYVVNKVRVGVPVLGMVDAAAEKAGFFPVQPTAPSKPKLTASPAVDEEELEDAAIA
jgi:O-antigen biosynthesis protein